MTNHPNRRNTPKAIATYLASLPNVFDVRPCTITIRGTAYPAAAYKQTTQLDPSCRAYAEGQREHTREMVYVAGELPACKRNGNVAFTVADDSRDWYVCAYYPDYTGRAPQSAIDANNPEYRRYHPFGMNFLLCPWDVTTTRIDTYERHPYKRVPLVIEWKE